MPLALSVALTLSSPVLAYAQPAAPWPVDPKRMVMQPYDASAWKGMQIIAGGKGYANTPYGQVHYRDIGPRSDKPVLFLMHQSPFSMTEFAPIQDELAKLGYRSVSVDLPGYGMSDEPKVQPAIADYARTMIAVLDTLGLKKVVLAGHHTGASIAAAMAARYPDRVIAVVLHGTPYYTAAQATETMSMPLHQKTLHADGSHFTEFFNIASGGPNRPNKTEALMENGTWAVLGFFMQGRDYGHIAAFSNNMGADLVRIKAPTLILSDPGLLHDNDVAAAKLRPDFVLQDFASPPGNPVVEQAPQWAKTVVAFVTAHTAKP